MRASLLLVVVLLGLISPTDRAHVTREVHGWTVHVDAALLEGPDAAEGARALSMLANHLERISLLVTGERLAELRELEIWIDHDHPGIRGMQYHPDLAWLQARGHDERLHEKVHVPQARELLSRAQLLKHPAVILHELAHAYHDQVLGFDDVRVLELFEGARAGGSYESVLSHRGRRVRHYALEDHKEYFAEATEAYLYRNDFYPFVAAELAEFDPPLHALMADLWGAPE
jgi:hypothetical protein